LTKKEREKKIDLITEAGPKKSNFFLAHQIEFARGIQSHSPITPPPPQKKSFCRFVLIEIGLFLFPVRG
jgi:hypothetical protein